MSSPAYGKADPPIMGVGQGVLFGPSLFALISSKMIEMMKRKGYGTNLASSLSLTLVSIVCFAFVDDTDVINTGTSRTTTGEEMLPKFQEALDRWAGALKATGGELAPAKSCFALIDFQWNRSDWKYRSEEDMPGNCTLNDKFENPHNLK